MKNTLRIGTALIGLTLASMAATAAAQTVEIGGTTLDLGESRADTLAIANAQFDVSPTGTSGHYNLYPKPRAGDSRDTPRGPAIGSLTLEDDRLVRVTHNLGSFRSQDAEAAIENLIAAFDRAPASGERPSVHTDRAGSGQGGTSRVYFSYPDRVIQIVIYRPDFEGGMATIDITEQYALRGGSRPQSTPMAE
ncbi:hypothetical protein [Salinisphaera orenii]|uniref:Uncharacterized protein n=1 Tax=Salinisphaera orenii YIM 95161 TaxID=1051139 RepID=A0A423PDZ8_9GAMM|nr:hypothetical protein [Salinisphaera halophila]ROO23743.1 hypothetical protein SAHL_16675 [Salinisphaera halophila YIM 95161]